jgi:hypothetical protein
MTESFKNLEPHCQDKSPLHWKRPEAVSAHVMCHASLMRRPENAKKNGKERCNPWPGLRLMFRCAGLFRVIVLAWQAQLLRFHGDSLHSKGRVTASVAFLNGDGEQAASNLKCAVELGRAVTGCVMGADNIDVGPAMEMDLQHDWVEPSGNPF